MAQVWPTLLTKLPNLRQGYFFIPERRRKIIAPIRGGVGLYAGRTFLTNTGNGITSTAAEYGTSHRLPTRRCRKIIFSISSSFT
jgi:hypothetical protein